ncbi:DUF1330 domain-containing protein [Falsihalocynthiibacter arcticus]|uniref:DUF1330 domain-containing protein n=1 Tax=Falsihalocynthiibacter arcticus TaxID=1579316 RepID=A0A126UVP4_9RHOB|nr:DUF1330 domain-containing protein [Falsihalocynthiibacter arcticus]AML49947.1 hypothetical protein RC74_00420 [Falsihalocynthiibacter arcticus]
MTDSLKGYWIAHVDVGDPDGYKSYVAANGVAFAKFNGRFLVRGTPQEVVEGHVKSRTIVIEFPSLEAAKACYNCDEYQAAKALRAPVSDCDLTIIEGWLG